MGRVKSASRLRLTASWRKALLALHLVASGVWLGIAVVAAILLIGAQVSGEPSMIKISLAVLPRFTTWPLIMVGLLTMITGVLLGLGSKYGLMRYRWIMIKISVTVILVTAMITRSLLSWKENVAAGSAAVLDPDAPAPGLGLLAAPPAITAVAITALLALSIAKPKGWLGRRPDLDEPTERGLSSPRAKITQQVKVTDQVKITQRDTDIATSPARSSLDHVRRSSRRGDQHE